MSEERIPMSSDQSNGPPQNFPGVVRAGYDLMRAADALHNQVEMNPSSISAELAREDYRAACVAFKRMVDWGVAA